MIYMHYETVTESITACIRYRLYVFVLILGQVLFDLFQIFSPVNLPPPDGLDPLSVLGEPIAGDHEIDQGDEGPYHEYNAEHLMLVQIPVEPHVVDLDPEHVVDGRVPGVGREAAGR